AAPRPPRSARSWRRTARPISISHVRGGFSHMMDGWSSAEALPTGRTRTAEFMAGVYRWMAFGLALTGMVAYAVINSPSILSAFFRVEYGRIVGVSGLFWLVGIAELAVVFLFVPLLNRLSMGAAVGMFLGYCALSGVTFSVYLLMYT